MFASRLLLGIMVSLGVATPVWSDTRPNILLCVADDWGWPHAGAYGDPVVQTPATRYGFPSSSGIMNSRFLIQQIVPSGRRIR